MKRKRGHKKGNKSKKSKSITDQGNLNEPTENTENQASEQSSGGPAECDDSEHESKTEVDAPSSTASGNSPIASSPVATASADNNMMTKSVGRVKVKLKSSKAPEPDLDVVKISPHADPEKSAVAVEKKEDLVPRLPERKPVFFNVYRKTKGIKIKSSKVVDGSSSIVDKSSDAVKAQDATVLQKDTKTPDDNSQANKQEPESAPISFQKEQKKADTDQDSRYNKQQPESAPIPFHKEQKEADQNSRYNKQELEDSLTVIKKIMKMDAADPFNVPVNPEALGIPDYFDIIKTPMDFGTICTNFEKGNKYMNSEDVYKDVQYIWNNCSKYNKKGDFIVDLMKRVKKNFMKYWTAAGLYTEQSADSAQLEASSKGSQAKQKSHKRHGRHHKSDCMCAICILKRRKRERERGSPAHSGAKEESSPVGSQSIDNSSINMDEEQDMDVDVDNKTGQGKSEIVELDSPLSEKQRVTENKPEVDGEEEGKGEEEEEEEDEEEEEENHEVESENRAKTKAEDKTQSIDTLMEETGDQPVTSAAEKLVVLSSDEGPKSIHNEEEEKEYRLQEQKKLQELERKEWRAKMHEKFQVKNPQLLSLCNVLFPNSDNHNSVWSGPHSMFKGRRASNLTSSLHKAVETLMN